MTRYLGFAVVADTCSVGSDILVGYAYEEGGKMLFLKGFVVLLIKTGKLVGWEVVVFLHQKLYKLRSLCVGYCIRNKIGVAVVFVAEEVDDALVVLKKADSGVSVALLLILHNLIYGFKLVIYFNSDIEGSVLTFLQLSCVTDIENLLTVKGETKLHKVNIIALLIGKGKEVVHHGFEFVASYLKDNFRTYELCTEKVKLKNLKISVIILYFKAEVVGLKGEPFYVKENALSTHTETAFSCLGLIYLASSEA